MALPGWPQPTTSLSTLSLAGPVLGLGCQWQASGRDPALTDSQESVAGRAQVGPASRRVQGLPIHPLAPSTPLRTPVFPSTFGLVVFRFGFFPSPSFYNLDLGAAQAEETRAAPL